MLWCCERTKATPAADPCCARPLRGWSSPLRGPRPSACGAAAAAAAAPWRRWGTGPMRSRSARLCHDAHELAMASKEKG
eukprot:scaffold51166_cov19-Tisochrysis_lutea.AAC.2